MMQAAGLARRNGDGCVNTSLCRWHCTFRVNCHFTRHSKLFKVSRPAKNVKHLDAILNWTVENQVVLKALDAE